MPLIRYRTRDLTRLLPGTARTMRRMERVKGRSDDMLIIRGVNVFPSQIEAALSGEDKLAPHYVLELRRSGRLDELDIVVETRQLLGDRATSEREGLRLRAEHLIKSLVGVTSRVRIVDPGVIERSQGKAKRVIDLRPKN
jgi:phenylacetate-CoA ligase